MWANRIDANVTPIFITNHQFSSMYVPSGTFSPGAASGTIAYDPDGPGPTPVCPQITWDAATSAQVTATATATTSPTATTAPTGTVAGTTPPNHRSPVAFRTHPRFVLRVLGMPDIHHEARRAIQRQYPKVRFLVDT